MFTGLDPRERLLPDSGKLGKLLLRETIAAP